MKYYINEKEENFKIQSTTIENFVPGITQLNDTSYWEILYLIDIGGKQVWMSEKEIIIEKRNRIINDILK